MSTSVVAMTRNMCMVKFAQHRDGNQFTLFDRVEYQNEQYFLAYMFTKNAEMLALLAHTTNLDDPLIQVSLLNCISCDGANASKTIQRKFPSKTKIFWNQAESSESSSVRQTRQRQPKAKPSNSDQSRTKPPSSNARL